MVVTSTTGYIISIIGPFFANSNNNDASIWKDCSTKNRGGVLAWLEENDVIIADRDFRDSTETMNTLRLQFAIPLFLNGRKSVILIS